MAAVDAIATELVAAYVTDIKKYGALASSGIKYVPGLATYEQYTTLGKLVGPTPDGRFAGDPLSSNASPSIGRATSGPTAAVNSYLKLPLGDLPGGSIIDLSMDAGSGLLKHLEDFIRAYIKGGGNILSIAVNDVGQLRAALKEPEKYRDLKVRVGGYEAFFVDLPRHHQELQIKRCEQYV
jgi:pyruvate-formate lyase